MQPLVLIVDDEVDFTDIIAVVLRTWGCKTLIAHDGFDAYHLALTLKPDLVITDSNMPRMSGLELAKKLQANPTTNEMPIILMSGLPDTQAAFPLSGFLHKPFRAEDLRDVICSIPSTPQRQEWLSYLDCNLRPVY